MMHIAVVIRRSTLQALREHSEADSIGPAIPLNDTEAVVRFDREVIEELFRRARPQDERLDDVILRAAL